MADPFENWLEAEVNQARIDLIRTDLAVCLMFADIAETEFRLGNREHAEQLLAKAEKGYSDMFRFFGEAKGMTTEVESELDSTFKRLRERLDLLGISSNPC